MLNTKDLLLFVLVVIFLLLAIMFTLDRDTKAANTLAEVIFDNQEISTKAVIYEEPKIDRNSTIAHLREAIKGEEIVMAVTPTEEIEEEVIINTGEKCTERDNLTLARAWPREGVKVRETEGVRQVVHITSGEDLDNSQAQVVGSTNSIKTLLLLPLRPSPAANSTCVSDTIVGVTVSGGLLFNSDAIVYRSKTAGDLVGYARDGFPVYGNYSGTVDECGGVELAGQYRYYLSSENNKILNCYRATPQNFVGE